MRLKRQHRLQGRVKRNIANTARLGTILVFLGLAIWALYLDFRYEEDVWIVTNSSPGKFLAHALISLGPELAGIVVGVVTIDYLNERRQDAQLRARLIRQMGSRYPDVAVTAAREMRDLEWGFGDDKTLFRASLDGANLEGASLSRANLEGADLNRANLEGADLSRANLEGADLNRANLEGASLGRANLENASLRRANLKGAWLGNAYLKAALLWKAELDGARLFETVLEGALVAPERLSQAVMLEGATMPDGTRLRGRFFPDGPTFDEWLAKQDKVTEAQMAGIDNIPNVKEWALKLLAEGMIDNEEFNTMVSLVGVGLYEEE